MANVAKAFGEYEAYPSVKTDGKAVKTDGKAVKTDAK